MGQTRCSRLPHSATALLSMSLLSVSILFSLLSLLSISSLLSVSTQPALLAYITLLFLLPNSVSDSCSLSISIPFLTISTSIFGELLYSTTSALFDLCLSLICLSRLYFEANLRRHRTHLYPFSTVLSIFI